MKNSTFMADSRVNAMNSFTKKLDFLIDIFLVFTPGSRQINNSSTYID
jgi:hypothetical protein